MRANHLGAMFVAGASILSACKMPQADDAHARYTSDHQRVFFSAEDTAKPDSQAVTITTLANGLAFPWGLAVLDDGRILISERDGALRIWQNGVLSKPLAGLPTPFVDGQAGYFDVAIHPNFAQNGLIYLAFAGGSANANHLQLARAKLVGNQLQDVRIIFSATPTKKGNAHYGGRIQFLPDNSLLLSIGEGYDYRDKAQTPDTHFGKIVHLMDDGQPVKNGPFAQQSGALADIYTIGHRNPQGLTIDPATGTIFEIEHGPRGGDEINILHPGRNYGWPAITYGVDYSGAPIADASARAGMEQPMHYWVPSIAPSDIQYYSGSMFPQWRGDLIVTALAGQQIRRVDLHEGQSRAETIIVRERGERYRAVVQAPDGALLVLTDAPDGALLRITPR